MQAMMRFVIGIDAAVQWLVDQASFRFQRLGADKPMQVAALHLLMAWTLVCGRRWPDIAFAGFWALLAPPAYFVERLRVAQGWAPRGHPVVRAASLALLLHAMAGALVSFDGQHLAAAAELVAIVYLRGTGSPPPRRRRVRKLVPVPV